MVPPARWGARGARGRARERVRGPARGRPSARGRRPRPCERPCALRPGGLTSRARAHRPGPAARSAAPLQLPGSRRARRRGRGRGRGGARGGGAGRGGDAAASASAPGARAAPRRVGSASRGGGSAGEGDEEGARRPGLRGVRWTSPAARPQTAARGAAAAGPTPPATRGRWRCGAAANRFEARRPRRRAIGAAGSDGSGSCHVEGVGAGSGGGSGGGGWGRRRGWGPASGVPRPGSRRRAFGSGLRGPASRWAGRLPCVRVRVRRLGEELPRPSGRVNPPPAASPPAASRPFVSRSVPEGLPLAAPRVGGGSRGAAAGSRNPTSEAAGAGAGKRVCGAGTAEAPFSEAREPRGGGRTPGAGACARRGARGSGRGRAGAVLTPRSAPDRAEEGRCEPADGQSGAWILPPPLERGTRPP